MRGSLEKAPALALALTAGALAAASAAASGAVQAGAFAGGASGPAVFGLLVTHVGYPFAWRGASLLLMLAAGMVLLARRLFQRDLEVRPFTPGVTSQPSF